MGIEYHQPLFLSATANFHTCSQRRKTRSSPDERSQVFSEPQIDRFFSEEELGKIKVLVKPDVWKMIAFAVETCLRAGEQFHLRWEQVSFEAKTLTIPMPKGSKTRRVPLSDEALDILRSLDSLMQSPWVFPNPNDPLKARDAHAVSEQFRLMLKRAGINGASWHTLRHTGASRRLLAGVDIVTVSKILGHSTITTTMRYLHLVQSHLQEAINRGSLAKTENREIGPEPGVKPGSSGRQKDDGVGAGVVTY